MTKANFDFITQIKAGNLYELLIPDKEKGILIFKIYEHTQNGGSDFFSEEDLMKIISNHKNYPIKEQHEDIKDIIRDLNEFFLKETRRGYRLSEYGKSFCQGIKEKLGEDIKTSEIVKRLTGLKSSLKENEFNDWFEIFFNEQKVHIERQLESLERQVINTIKQFRKDIIEENIDVIKFVKKVLGNLEEINTQTQKLKDALRYADDINREVDNIDLNSTSQQEKALVNQQSVKFFFETIFFDLERISRRIEKIQPKLRQFYGDMNRIDFERNSKKLLEYLLENTQIVGYKPNWKLKFPNTSNNILALDNKNQVLSSKFQYVDNLVDLYKTKRIKFKKPKINRSELDKIKVEKQYKIKAREDINSFIGLIKNDLEEKKIISLKDYFFEILFESRNMNVPVRIAYLLVKEYKEKEGYEIVIQNQYTRNPKFNNILLWNLEIKKKI